MNYSLLKHLRNKKVGSCNSDVLKLHLVYKTVYNFLRRVCTVLLLFSLKMYEPSKKADPAKTRKEDTIRCRVLNGLIHKAVAEMMSSCEVNKEVYDLKLEICKASKKASAFPEVL